MCEYFEIEMNNRRLDAERNYFDKAQSKFNQNDCCDRQLALKTLQDMIGASIDLALKDKSCYSDEEFLNRFLHAKKFKCNDAYKLLVEYLLFKQRNNDLFQNLHIFDGNIQCALRDGNPSVLKYRDRKGRKVIFFSPANWDTTKYTLEDIYRSFLLSLDKLLENKKNQAFGFVVIIDWTNFTLRQSVHLTPKVLKLMVKGFENSFPVKFKAIHFVAQPWYVEIAFVAIKPFLNYKAQRQIKLHGRNLATLHECIAKDILPPELGGEGPSLNTLDWFHHLLESSQVQESQKSYRIIQKTHYNELSQLSSEKCMGSVSNKLDNLDMTSRSS